MADEDYKMEDITPEELGCLGEREIDDGVLEESVPVKKPKSRCFENVPFESRKLYRKFYDEFFTPEGRDMTFENFAIELYALSSPALMQQDLSGMADQIHTGVARKQAIDRTAGRMN